MREVLHVGCGYDTITALPAGFQDGTWREVRFDINPDVRPDIIGTITDMTAVETDKYDALYSAHNIEHVYAHEVPSMLREFLRVLKPDGFTVITCPDIEIVAEHVAAGRLLEPLYVSPAGPISALDILYGHGPAIERGEHYMAHRTAFSAITLNKALGSAGFATVGMRRRPSEIDLWAIATKNNINNEAMRELMAGYLPPATG